MSAKPDNALARQLADRITREGPIPVAAFMEAAATAYYAHQHPFGRDGDFITAPEISQMFGEMIGAWLTDLWLNMGQPDAVNLVELGPGTGTLAADIIRTISAWPDFKAAASLHLVETSPRLRQKQKETLKEYDVHWHDRIEDVPRGLCFIVANEFFDALPIHQFIKQDGAWRERMVGFDAGNDTFFFTTATADEGGETSSGFPAAPDGSIFEMSPLSFAVIEDIGQRIAEDGGTALIIDYGHARPGFGDTLQALSRHAYADALQDPGNRDITAHVDFGTLGAVARQHVAVHGPVAQGHFLRTLGIDIRAAKLCEKATATQQAEIMSALHRLTAPEQMGTLFKVMALTPKESIIEPAGFGGSGDEVSDN